MLSGKLCLPFASRRESRVSSPFHLVHSDIWGPINTPSLLGFRYFVIFIDDYSKVTYLYLMKECSELYSIFKSFYMKIKTQFNASLRIFWSENAHEYFLTSLSQFFDDHGIIHQSSCPHTPQQNGVAKRKMRHFLKVTCAIKFHMRVPKSYWSDVVLTACHLINRMHSTILSGQIPYTVLSPNAPLFHLPPKIFGWVCYVHILGLGSDKLDPRSIKCVFLRYSHTQKGYRCYSPTLHRRFISADVTFDESQSYFSPSVASHSSPPFIESPHKPLQVYCHRQKPPTKTSSPPSDPPLDPASLPIALCKGKRSCTSHPIS